MLILTKAKTTVLLLILICLILLVGDTMGKDRTTPSKAKCLLKRSIGMCKAAMRRFYFNTKTLQCEPFIFGGCHGNANNFRTRKECEKKCAKYFTRRPEKG